MTHDCIKFSRYVCSVTYLGSVHDFLQGDLQLRGITRTRESPLTECAEGAVAEVSTGDTAQVQRARLTHTCTNTMKETGILSVTQLTEGFLIAPPTISKSTGPLIDLTLGHEIRREVGEKRSI